MNAQRNQKLLHTDKFINDGGFYIPVQILIVPKWNKFNFHFFIFTPKCVCF